MGSMGVIFCIELYKKIYNCSQLSSVNYIKIIIAFYIIPVILREKLGIDNNH